MSRPCVCFVHSWSVGNFSSPPSTLLDLGATRPTLGSCRTGTWNWSPRCRMGVRQSRTGRLTGQSACRESTARAPAKSHHAPARRRAYSKTRAGAVTTNTVRRSPHTRRRNGQIEKTSQRRKRAFLHRKFLSLVRTRKTEPKPNRTSFHHVTGLQHVEGSTRERCASTWRPQKVLPKQAATEPAPAAARAQAPTQAGDGAAQLALPPRAQAWRPRKRASSARAPQPHPPL